MECPVCGGTIVPPADTFSAGGMNLACPHCGAVLWLALDLGRVEPAGIILIGDFDEDKIPHLPLGKWTIH